MLGLGWPELIIILVIVVILFGVGRVGKIAGELGKGIRSFKKEMQAEDEDSESRAEDNTSDSE